MLTRVPTRSRWFGGEPIVVLRGRVERNFVMSMLYSSSPAPSHLKPCHDLLDSRKFSLASARREPSYPGTFLMSVAALFTAGSISASAATAITPSSPQPSEVSVASAQIFGLPMQFEKNAGQTDQQVQFLARGSGYTLFLTPTQAVFSLSFLKNAATDEKRAGRHDGRR